MLTKLALTVALSASLIGGTAKIMSMAFVSAETIHTVLVK